MARTHVVQSSFLSGVLDPRASARVDTDAYAQGLLTGVNIEPVHLGGVRRRRGLRYRAAFRNQISRVSTGVTVTAPNGGTTGNANDYDESTLLATTTNVSTNDPYVVVHYDLGSAKTIYFADAVGIVSTGGSSTEFAIQHSTDNVVWVHFQSAFDVVNTDEHTYRRAGPVTARYWRIVKIGGTDMGAVTVSISGFNLWETTATVSAGRLIPFEVSTDEQYVVVLTDRSAAIFQDGVLAAYQPTPYTSADLEGIDAAASAETLVLVHEDYHPRFIVRESTTNFQQFQPTFTSVPQVDFGDTSSPTPVSDVQVITFDANWRAGDTFQISLMGAKTGPITFAGDSSAVERTATASNIEREVQGLWTVRAFTGVSVSRTGALAYTVTFAAASAAPYELMGVTVLSNSNATKPAAAVTQSAVGTSRHEPVWSSTRGYPRTVEFFEGRLYFGGTRSKQQSILGSEVNNILAMEVGEGLDDDPVFTTLNGRQLNAIQGLFAGRSLQLFTSGGEFRYVKEQGTPITPGDYPVNQTQYGAAKVRPVTIDGATIFIQRNRKSVRDFRFDYTENAYNSLGVSALAPHLIYDVKDLAAWNGSATDEIGLVFVVNGTNPDTSADAFPDGTVAVFNSRKEAKVQAWAIWTTDGQFKAVCAVNEDIFFLVQRNINGVETLFLEQGDADYYTDCAVKVTNSPASTSVSTGLGHLDGEECRVRADGFVLENITPTGGAATLSQAAADIEVGLDWTPEVTPMPLQTLGGTGSNFMRKRRIVSVKAKVRNTLGLLMNGRPLPDRAYDVDSLDTPADPFTGVHDIEESTNYDQSEDKLVTFTQVDPLPMEILGIEVQMEGES